MPKKQTRPEAARMESADDRCIWCGAASTSAPPEHVIPEALGCPRDAVLTHGEVCATCNHGLAHLDQALVASLDLPAFLAGVPRKGGKPPTIATRSNVYAEYRDGEPAIHINLGPGDVTLPGGRVLKAPARPGSVQSTLTIDGQFAEIDGKAHMLHHPNCSRALHKIALESIALTITRVAALEASLDGVREYVRLGTGSPKTVLFFSPRWEPSYRHELRRPWRSSLGYGVHFQLCGIEFLVDCTPTQCLLADWKGQLERERGGEGWCWIPLAGG